MSRITVFGLLAVLFLCLNAGCSKDEPATGEIKTNYLKVKIDGDEKSFSDVQARWIDGGNYLEITGNDGGQEWVTITVLSETTRVPAGKYMLDDGSAFTILSTHLVKKNNTQLNHTATRGTLAAEDAFTLDIDKIDNGLVEGSFSGKLVRVSGANTLSTVALADGKFKSAIKAN